jgi:D-glycero-alpha-D-manno-heptose-7-phosphate kinase
MYVAIHPYFHDKIRIKYSRTEDVASAADVQHPLVRECLHRVGIERGMEIASFADVPAGTGMGSSSAFTVGLLHALAARAGLRLTSAELAVAACEIEIDKVGEPIGKQDQFAVACGGLNYIRFFNDERVVVEPIRCSAETREKLNSRLMLFYLGQERMASSILAEQARNMADSEKFSRVARIADLAEELYRALESDDLDCFGEILHQGWLMKSAVAAGITNDLIDSSYRLGREAGAEGGKLLGAGGGGFLLRYCREEKQSHVRTALSQLREMPFRMSTEGTRVLCDDGQNGPIHGPGAAT